MTVQIQIELPESVFSALRSNPDRFVQEMRLAAAVKWYEIEMISQAKAAEIAGVSRNSTDRAFSSTHFKNCCYFSSPALAHQYQKHCSDLNYCYVLLY